MGARYVRQRQHEFGETTPCKVSSLGICTVNYTQLAEFARQPLIPSSGGVISAAIQSGPESN